MYAHCAQAFVPIHRQTAGNCIQWRIKNKNSKGEKCIFYFAPWHLIDMVNYSRFSVSFWWHGTARHKHAHANIQTKSDRIHPLNEGSNTNSFFFFLSSTHLICRKRTISIYLFKVEERNKKTMKEQQQKICAKYFIMLKHLYIYER